jgi:hypothetical protein
MFDISSCRSSLLTVVVRGKPVEVIDTGYRLTFSRKARNVDALFWDRETSPRRVLVAANKTLAPDEYDAFAGDLLSSHEWLRGLGGACDSGVLCVEVCSPGRPTLYVNPDCYDYARYVARLPAVNDLLSEIAMNYLSIPTLEEQGRDLFDFREVGVAALRAALHAAFRAGVNAA